VTLVPFAATVSRFGRTTLQPLSASPLAWLADVLALALGDAVPTLGGAGDASVVAAHLDIRAALLDACNAGRPARSSPACS
jgi:hypothetical protein